MNILTNMQNQNSLGSGSLPSNTIANPRGDVKAITTQSSVAYDGPTIPPTPSPLPKEVERETEVTKDKVQNINLGSTAHVQPLRVVQDPIPEPEVVLKPNPKPSIPYPLRLNDQKLREKANNQMLNSTSGNPTPSDPIIASSSPSFTPFEGGDFILEEMETFLYPSPNLPPMKNDDLKKFDVTMTKPSIAEPPKLELKDLPSHLEHAFL
ncbi:hypothetical protein Tco_0566817 [Tanacetum coccineum]